jgi:ribosomal 50S subunit-recycling heat shock protein
MKKVLLVFLLCVLAISSAFSLNWRWTQRGSEFLLLSPSGDVELGFRIKKAFMPVKFYTNNNSYLYFIDANNVLRAYKLRARAGSAIMSSLISVDLNDDWGRFITKNSKNVKSENEIGLKFEDEKTRIFSVNSQTNQFEMIRESYY